MRGTIGGLDALLRNLRAERLPIGALEVARLQAAFAAFPELSKERLATLLRCTLAKDDAQVETFERVFENWFDDADRELRSDSPPKVDSGTFLPQPQTPPPRRRWPIYLAIVLALAGVIVWHSTREREHRPSRVDPGNATTVNQNGGDPPPDPPRPTPPAFDLPSEPVATYTRWTVAFDLARDVTYPASPRWLLLIPLALSLATAAGIWFLHLRTQRRGTPRPLLPGPSHEPLLPPPLPDRSLLTAAQVRMVVTGIDSFVAEEPSTDLDLPRTVAATAAAAGIVELLHAGARLPREVWLWLDRTSDQPTGELLVRDLQHALQRGGHAVRVAEFWGDLTEITWESSDARSANSDRVSPLALEAHRQQALVAVFTDGNQLRHNLDSAQERPAQEQVLTALSRWPHVALVDCNPAATLRDLTDQYDLRHLTPPEAPEFVGLQRRAAAPHSGLRPLRYELGEWAQTLALWPHAFTEADALDAHARLDLTLPRYDAQSLLAHAEPCGVGHAFPAQVRGMQLRNLADSLGTASAEADPSDAPACAYWLERLQQEDEARAREQTPHQPWTDTEAQARLQMERALVQLWTDPDAAAVVLDGLSCRPHHDAPAGAATPLRAEIETRLAEYVDADLAAQGGASRSIALPWSWRALQPHTRLRLWQLGFAGRPWRLGVRIQPGRRTVQGLGLCAGVALACVGWLVVGQGTPSDVPTTFVAPPPEPWLIQSLLTSTGELAATNAPDPTMALLGEPGAAKLFNNLPRSARLAPRWTSADIPNAAATEWHRGERARAQRPRKGIDTSIAVLRATPDEKDARQLAIALLDSGTVDRVEFSKDRSLTQVMVGSLASQGFCFEREEHVVRSGETLESIGRLTNTLWVEIREANPALDPSKLRPGMRIRLPARRTPLSFDRELMWPPNVPADYRARFADRARWAIVTQADFAAAARALSMKGTPSEIWQGCRTSPSQPEVHQLTLLYARIPAGEFLMGSAAEQGHSDERPQHKVTVAPFELWRTEFTRGEYRAIMPTDSVPREWTEPDDARLPANHIDFWTALRCCNELSKRAGLAPYYEVSSESMKVLGGEGYRLPSEAEWEYACRAGTTTQYWSGDTEADLARVGWYVENSDSRVHAVGEKKQTNAYGLHDMHGNVVEWCEDEWHRSYEGAPTDGRAWLDSNSASSFRVLRGGSFVDSAGIARSAVRSFVRPDGRFARFGFRPARSVARG